ncbi:unnamed protein product, partial [Phaeothamnion confervicola]
AALWLGGASAAQAAPYLVTGEFDISGAASGTPEAFTVTLTPDGAAGSPQYTFSYDPTSLTNPFTSTDRTVVLTPSGVSQNNIYDFSFEEDIVGSSGFSFLDVTQSTGSYNATGPNSPYQVGQTFTYTGSGADASSRGLYSLAISGTPVPEIDPGSCTLPLALTLGALLLGSDRRRRKA